MRSHFLLSASLLILACSLSFAKDKEKDKANPAPKPKSPAVLSAKTIAFVTCFPGEQAEQMKQQATVFFTKWKRYQVIENSQKADLIVLLGAIPRYVSEADFRAVLTGNPPSKFAPPPAGSIARTEAPDSPPLFTVFDGASSLAPETHQFHSLWSHEMDETKVAATAKDFKNFVSRSADNYTGNGFNFQVCQMLHTAFC